jgi:hypothetical protein
MGFQILQMLPESKIISLDMEHSGGTAWVCAAGFECGVMGLTGPTEGDERGIALYYDSEMGPSTGSLLVGTISASMPAKGQ